MEFTEGKVPGLCTAPLRPFPAERLRSGISSVSSNIRKMHVYVCVCLPVHAWLSLNRYNSKYLSDRRVNVVAKQICTSCVK